LAEPELPVLEVPEVLAPELLALDAAELAELLG